MKQIFNNIFAEAFAGLTPLTIAKRVISFILFILTILIVCLSYKMNGAWVAFWLCLIAGTFKLLGLPGKRQE